MIQPKRVLKKDPIRVVFCLKDQAAPAGHRELMGALRASPRLASIARAQAALTPYYKVQLAFLDANGELAPGMRVVNIELSAAEPGMDFEAACKAAMRAMRLASEHDDSGAALLVRLRDAPDGARREGGSVHERLEAFRVDLAHLLSASSADLDRAALCPFAGQAPPPLKSSWL